MKRSLLAVMSLVLVLSGVGFASAATTASPKPTATAKAASKPTAKPKTTTKPKVTPKTTASPKPKSSPTFAVKAPDCTKAKIVFVKVTADGVFSHVDGLGPNDASKLALKVNDPLLVVFDADVDYEASLPGTAMATYKGTKGVRGVCVSPMQVGKTMLAVGKTGFVELTVSK